MQRGPSQIGVDHNPGRIDDPTESMLHLKLNFFLEKGVEMFEGEEIILYLGEVLFLDQVLSDSSQTSSDGLYDDGSRIGSEQIGELRS
jgi:hypothetical protein